MRKSAIAIVAVAAMGVAGAANAGYWEVTGANYANGSNFDIGSGPSSTLGGPTMTLTNGVHDSSALGGSPLSFDPVAATGTVLTGLGITLANNTLTYFGFDQTSTGPGSFGVAFKAVGGNIRLGFNAGANASNGDQGVLANMPVVAGSLNTFGGAFMGTFDVASGSTLVVVFGGLASGGQFSLNVTRASSPGSMSNFEISYLSFSGGSYTQVGSATNATASGLNIGTYAIPVPAPALLAGAGLVGAAALRRRMAKKA